MPGVFDDLKELETPEHLNPIVGACHACDKEIRAMDLLSSFVERDEVGFITRITCAACKE